MPIRTLRWIGGQRPGQLALSVRQPVPSTLVIEIDNGDDPPLPVDDIQVTVPSWELVTMLPPGPTRLYHGNPKLPTPDYDLALLEPLLASRVVQRATLGPAEAAPRRALSWLDRAMLATGIGILAVGLMWLLADLIRRTPAPPAEGSA